MWDKVETVTSSIPCTSTQKYVLLICSNAQHAKSGNEVEKPSWGSCFTTPFPSLPQVEEEQMSGDCFSSVLSEVQSHVNINISEKSARSLHLRLCVMQHEIAQYQQQWHHSSQDFSTGYTNLPGILGTYIQAAIFYWSSCCCGFIALGVQATWIKAVLGILRHAATVLWSTLHT